MRTLLHVDDDGSILLVVLLGLSLVGGIAISLALVVQVDVHLAHHHRQSAEAMAGAEAGVDIVVGELRALADWTPVVDGRLVSPLSQGAFAGRRAMPWGSVLLCCGSGSMAASLSAETLGSSSAARRRVRWSPFLWTRLDALAPRQPPSAVFLTVWVGNDEADRDGGATIDTNGVVLVRSEAQVAPGIRRGMEALVGRPVPRQGLVSAIPLTDAEWRMRVGIMQWREVR